MEITAYTDGSYLQSNIKYAYGCVILTDTQVVTIYGYGDDPEAAALRNIAGELLGAMHAIQWAYKNGYRKITIYHDYNGLGYWARYEWEAKKKQTQQYQIFLEQYRSKGMEIEFIHLRGHSGNKYNTMADKLAKKGLSATEKCKVEIHNTANMPCNIPGI